MSYHPERLAGKSAAEVLAHVLGRYHEMMMHPNLFPSLGLQSMEMQDILEEAFEAMKDRKPAVPEASPKVDVVGNGLVLVNPANVQALKDRVQRMQSALQLAGAQFRFYASQHRDKAKNMELCLYTKIEETLAKALVNEDFAALCEKERGEESHTVNVCEYFSSWPCADHPDGACSYQDCESKDCPMKKALGVKP